jgi:hypothetical protein
MVPIAVVGIIAAVGLHAGGAIYVASIATDPLSEPSRREHLDSVERTLEKLRELGRPIGDEKIAQLRADIALLRKNIATGWLLPEEYAAAARLAAFKGYEHTKGAFVGTGTLIYNCASRVTDALDKKMDDMFSWMSNKPSGDPDGNIRT